MGFWITEAEAVILLMKFYMVQDLGVAGGREMLLWWLFVIWKVCC